MGAAENNLEMEEGALEIGMGKTFLFLDIYTHGIISFDCIAWFSFSYTAEYRTVSGVAGPLVILEKVKVYSDPSFSSLSLWLPHDTAFLSRALNTKKLSISVLGMELPDVVKFSKLMERKLLFRFLIFSLSSLNANVILHSPYY